MADNRFINTWLRDWWDIFCHELKQIFSDGGVMLIFIIAGLAYPLLYNVVYLNGLLEDTPVAVVDDAEAAAEKVKETLNDYVEDVEEEEALDETFPEEVPYLVVEQKPSFNGGDANEFSKWVNKNLTYPQEAQDKGIEGRVVLKFKVHKGDRCHQGGGSRREMCQYG